MELLVLSKEKKLSCEVQSFFLGSILIRLIVLGKY